MQGQISSLISEDTTIKGNYDALLSRYNETVNTVDSMKTTIGEHTTILNNQNDSIAAVTTKANTIESNLAGTTQTVSEVKSNLSGTQERVTKVETSLSGLTTRVSSTETNLANLEIGGRNLILNSDKEYVMGYGIPNTTWTDGYAYIGLPTTRINDEILPQNNAFLLHPEAGKTYTQTIWIETDANIIDLNAAEVSWFTGKYGHVPVAAKIIKLADNSYKLTSTYTITKEDSDIRLFDILHLFSALDISNSGTYLKFGKLKVEQGNVSTDWTPAPEDVDQQITAAETIASQTANKFNWLVKSGTNSTDFELTDRTATLVASAINMNGLVAFSGLNTDLQNTINNKANVSYMGLSSAGGTKGCWKIATINIRSSFVNQEIVIGANHREYGYTECRIRFQNTDNIDPELASFRQTGYPPRAWEIIKTATSTWDLYLWKTEPWDGGRVVKYINPYDDGLILVTWSGENADLPSGTTTTEQMIADQTTIDGGIITTGYISADRIAAGSITADKIDVNSIFAKDITATGTITGANLIGATGTFSGQITATEGKIGRYDITETYLKTGSGSTCSGIGSDDCAFWAGGTNSKDSNFIVSYDGSVFANNLMCNDRNSNDALAIINGTLYIQSDNNSSFLSSTGFEFKWGGDCRILSMGDGVKCYHTMYATDFVADGWIYNASGGHYTWKDRTDAYISCGSYNNTNNIYYYAGYHAFYVNGDSGSGMMYIETSGVSSRKGFRNSSDERIKKDFRHFDDDFIKSYMQLEPIKYRFKDDTDISYHIGFKAQNVNSVLNDYGKSHNEQFGICATHHIDPEYAEKTYGEKNMTEVYTLAYDELIGANTFMIQKTRKDLIYQAGRIDMQEAIINDLQTRLLQAEKTIKQLTQALA